MSAELVGVGLVLGLVVGSFLNVLIHRLPRMLEQEWQQDLQDWQAEKAEQAGGAELATASLSTPRFNLARPASHCPACGHVLAWREKLPLLSYVWQRGRCSACGQAIGWRYPAVELATGLLFAFCLVRWGLSVTALVWCVFAALLLALACIDQATQFLPDDLTQPLLWLGLVTAALGWNPGLPLAQALWGAVAGYLSLWLVYHLFKALTGKEGLGHGDFKLLAALGAWLGWVALPSVVVVASVSGALWGLAQRATGRLKAGEPMPFGPYLALGGFLAMLLGPENGWLFW